MLRATVALSRKVTGQSGPARYTVRLDGGIPFGPDDPDGVLDKVAELFHLAEEALRVEVERDRANPPATPDGDVVPAPSSGPPPGQPPAAGRADPLPMNRPPYTTTPTRTSRSSPESSTPKQQQYLQTLAKRKGLSRDDLAALVARLVGGPKKPAELTKREAGAVIDHLTNLAPEPAR